MLVPSDMMAAQSKMLYQLNKYYGERVQTRKGQIAKTLREVCKVVQDVLKEVEVQEPRFISSLAECNGRFEGLEVVSPGEFEVVLYLNQMGVFNFVDDGTQTQRRTKEIHVLVGRIHNSFRILVRQKDPIPVPNARRPGALNNRKPRE